ncbi:hypothetical protein GE09DRAFT_1229709 [Coniochaeta sp. 2T2.1]|nr:hypothetical protein GE09DRAFT_1229709 [Coniochaeta sp. 2T2.1]
MASTNPGSGNAGPSNPDPATAATTNNKPHAGKKTIYLKWMMPKGGFTWPDRPTVTKRMGLDVKITASMVKAGGADSKINKPNVVTFLVEAFEAFAAGLLINDPAVTDRETVTASAFAVAQAQVPWLNEVSVDVFLQLTDAICKARVAYYMDTPDEQYDAERRRLENSHAHRLFSATDDFIETFVPVARRYNWEGAGEGDDVAALTAGMGLEEDFGFELPPMQVITCQADADRYAAQAAEELAGLQRKYGRLGNEGEGEDEEGEEYEVGDEEDYEDDEDDEIMGGEVVYDETMGGEDEAVEVDEE